MGIKIILSFFCVLLNAAAGVLYLQPNGTPVAGILFLSTSLIWLFIFIMDIKNYREKNFIKFKDETLKDKIKRFFSL